MNKLIKQLFSVSFLVGLVLAAPQFPQQQFQQQYNNNNDQTGHYNRQQDGPPMPYDFQYKVDNPPTNTFFGHNENGDPAGRVSGSYFVHLPDGRLMTVDYTVDGDSGFVPRISFQNQGQPSQ